ncbi:hypothetical protein J2W69_001634 [Rheinheimera soli]|jgi:hypothetical protein|uniref:Uncharacterized protein n=1 Tax=Rheinheimera soli TaxID=443616 RepID=A0ABU1VY95_9GAMM|nr:hypothetical protein [Rheinheimera soli]
MPDLSIFAAELLTMLLLLSVAIAPAALSRIKTSKN